MGSDNNKTVMGLHAIESMEAEPDAEQETAKPAGMSVSRGPAMPPKLAEHVAEKRSALALRTTAIHLDDLDWDLPEEGSWASSRGQSSPAAQGAGAAPVPAIAAPDVSVGAIAEEADSEVPGDSRAPVDSGFVADSGSDSDDDPNERALGGGTMVLGSAQIAAALEQGQRRPSFELESSLGEPPAPPPVLIASEDIALGPATAKMGGITGEQPVTDRVPRAPDLSNSGLGLEPVGPDEVENAEPAHAPSGTMLMSGSVLEAAIAAAAPAPVGRATSALDSGPVGNATLIDIPARSDSGSAPTVRGESSGGYARTGSGDLVAVDANVHGAKGSNLQDSRVKMPNRASGRKEPSAASGRKSQTRPVPRRSEPVGSETRPAPPAPRADASAVVPVGGNKSSRVVAVVLFVVIIAAVAAFILLGK